MACAVSAFHAIGQRNAVFLNPDGMSDLDGRFVGSGYRENRTGRTYFRAARTLWAAVSALVGGDGLHKGGDVGRGTEHTVGTYRDAELTRGAVGGKMAQTLSSGRNNGGYTLRNLFIFNDRKAAIDFLFLGVDSRSRGDDSCGREELAAFAVDLFFRVTGRVRFLCRGSQPVGDRSLGAFADAVEAGYTTGIVDGVFLAVDA